MDRKLALIVTCEHASAHVPTEYRWLFEGSESVLGTHRAYDRGARELARSIGGILEVGVIEAPTTRLLADANRSPGNPAIFSPYSRQLSGSDRERLRKRWHAPHQDKVARLVGRHLDAGRRVVHLGVHSFIPRLDGHTRPTAVGILYDPSRRVELALARRWQRLARRELPRLRVDRNLPYRGWADGLTTLLRKRFRGRPYLGLELEANQRLLSRGALSWRALGQALARTLAEALSQEST